MRMIGSIASAMCLAGLLSAAHGQGAQGRLQETLHRLDASSASFKSAQASFHKELYTFPIPDPDVQDGIVYFQRSNGNYTMGARISGQGARTVQYSNGDLKVYNPGIKCYDEVSGAGNQKRIESFLTLGFGGSGRDLEKAWTITDEGPETMTSDGKPVAVEKLLLAPREQSVKNMVKTMTLWVDPERDVSLRQELISPTGDRQTAVYTHIRLNDKVNTEPFRFPDVRCSGKK